MVVSVRALVYGFALACVAVSAPTVAAAEAQAGASEKSLVDAERAMLRALSTQSVPAPAAPAAKKSAEPPPKVQKNPSPPKAAAAMNSEDSKSKVSPPANDVVAPKVASGDVAPTGPSKELQAALARISILEQQLDESRSQLAIAETEVSRLSGLVDSRARAGMNKYQLPVPAQRSAPLPQRRTALVQSQGGTPADNSPARVEEALHVATVMVEKAELRLGPGKNHSALMTVRQGSRLMIEARQGEWYRVFAPNGERAWIQAGLVSFGDGAASLNDGSSVRVKGFTAAAEEEAFRKLQRMSAGQ